jgi:hypothetical protein
MDAYRRGDDFVVHLDLPGVQSKTIDVTVENQVLTVEAERRFTQHEGDQFVVAERPQGSLQPPTSPRLDHRHGGHRRELRRWRLDPHAARLRAR